MGPFLSFLFSPDGHFWIPILVHLFVTSTLLLLILFAPSPFLMSPLPIRFHRQSIDYHVPLLISAKPRRPVQIGQQVYLHDINLPSHTIKTSVTRLAWLERGWVVFELEKVHPLASPMFIAVPFTWNSIPDFFSKSQVHYSATCDPVWSQYFPLLPLLSAVIVT
ncbi:hypothetical protein SERLADRAFT_386865, partial [Serpula lacrymans var. lacrymans S7.9]